MEKKLSEHEIASMFYEECMENAGIEDYTQHNDKDEVDDYVRLHTELNNDAWKTYACQFIPNK